MSLRPNTYVGLAFGANALAVTPVWTDMSTRLYAAQIERGRESRLDDFSPGTLQLHLRNTDGKLLPSNLASPYRTTARSYMLPGLQVLVADGFVGRTMMCSPSFYWTFDGSTTPLYDTAQSVKLFPRTTVAAFKPTFQTTGKIGRAASFDGVKNHLWTSLAAVGTLVSGGATGMGFVVVARLDGKNKRQQIFGFGPLFGSTLAARLTYTSQNKLEYGYPGGSVAAAATTGWHLILGSYKAGSKPIIVIDNVATSAGAVSTALTTNGDISAIGAATTSTAAAGQHFQGRIDELAFIANTGLTSGAIAQLYTEYNSRWKPGVVHFRGHARPQDPFTFSFPNKRDATVQIDVLDWTARLSNVTVPPTGPSTSTSPPIKLYAGDTPGTRIGRILDVASIPTGMRRLDAGTSLLLATTWNVNAWGEVQQVTKSENGAAYARREGQIVFDGRSRGFLDSRMATPQSTYSDQAGSTLDYINPLFGYGSLIRNDIIVGNSTFTTELLSTGSRDLFGLMTTDRSGLLNQSKNDLIEQGRFVLEQYSSALFAPTEITVKPLKSSAAYSAMCFRELRDRIRIKNLAPGTTTRSSQDVTVEKEVKTIARGEMIVTYHLDSADRFAFLRSSQLIVLDSTVAARRLNSGRLGF